jgi:hypothetical protein
MILLITLLSKPRVWIFLIGLLTALGAQISEDAVELIAITASTIAEVVKGVIGR